MDHFEQATISVTRTFTKDASTVWHALTAGIAEWWPKDFYIGTYDGIDPVGVVLDPTPGGLFVERWGEGNGLLWGTVITAHAPKLLALVGDSTPQFGGPNRAFTEFRLAAAEGGGTALEFSHSAYGVVSSDTSDSLESGWSLLLDHLVRWVESGEHPERPASVIAALG